MQIGVTYPQVEIEPDPEAVRQFTVAVEEMGFTHVLAYDHVLGANTATRPDWNRPYSIDSQFHDPFVLFSYMAGISTRLAFVTGILILPQRQTALVAKQAACLDVLCKGRFRLGIGTGWNELEYEALGIPFGDRGKRIEEQVGVLRALWTDRAVTYSGKFHSIPDVGLKPLPVQRPIPIWFGGGADLAYLNREPAKEGVMRRIARLGDGWIPPNRSREQLLALIGRMREYLREYGRDDPATFGIEVQLPLTRASQGTWAEYVRGWRDVGATHLVVTSMRDGLFGVEQHLERLREFRKAVPA
jgi:probable F420-dependent oxidoreductase